VERIKVIRRLLPLFEQYLPDTATSLRACLTELTGGGSTGSENFLLTQGLREDKPGDVLEGLQDRIDRARTSRERDEIYASAAVTLATRGDVHAREVMDKIDDSERRAEVGQFVDFQFVQLAITKKQVSEAVRLAETGQLTHTQRAFAYTQAARLTMESQRERSLELLEKATDEVLRIENGAVDRAVLLVGIAMLMSATEPVRVWDVMSSVAKAANASEDFNGENSIRYTVLTRAGIKTIGIGGENFSLSRTFQMLAQHDLYRSIDVAKSFKNDATRSTSTLAIARAILEKRRG
jgi:hypothetical protein